jgi:hypothetical protein
MPGDRQTEVGYRSGRQRRSYLRELMDRSQVWCPHLEAQLLGRLRWEDCKFDASLGSLPRTPSQKWERGGKGKEGRKKEGTEVSR